MNSNSKKLWDCIGWLSTAAILVIAIYCIWGIHSQKQTGELFFPFGYRPVVILSGSMEEELKTGSVVIVRQTKEVEEMDILFFQTSDGTLVIHRFIAWDEAGRLITKGDANPTEDLESISIDQVLGKVVFAF